jgi:hypothetical protein
LNLPSVADFVAVVGNEAANDMVLWAVQLGPKLPHPTRVIGVFGIRNNTGPFLADLQRSDHAPAWERGLPGVFLTDTADFRNPNYHTANDTPATLDPVFHAGTTELTVALTWAAQAFR